MIWSHPWFFLFHLRLMNKSCMFHLCYKCCNLTLFSLETSRQLSFWLISVATSQQLSPWPCSSNLWVLLYEPHHIMSCLCAQNFKMFPLSSEKKPSPSAGARRTYMIGLIYSSPLLLTSPSFNFLQTYCLSNTRCSPVLSFSWHILPLKSCTTSFPFPSNVSQMRPYQWSFYITLQPSPIILDLP